MLSNALFYQLNTVVEFARMSVAVIDIEGYLEPAEGYALMLLAEQGPGLGHIVELGSFKGKSTCWLAHGSKLAGRERVTAIDHFQGSPEHQAGGDAEDADIATGGSTLPAFKSNIARLGIEHVSRVYT